jgi:protein gp37
MSIKTISRTKIDWCTHVWNPVWGCENNCPYCYARKISKRFAYKMGNREVKYLAEDIDDTLLNPIFREPFIQAFEEFDPIFLQSNFDKRYPVKPSIIFVNSMSEIGFWLKKWVLDVMAKIRRSPEHVFVFLTKEYGIYSKIVNQYGITIPGNVVCGFTATTEIEYYEAAKERNKLNPDLAWHTMISIEPIHEMIGLEVEEFCGIPFGWVIVGAETGNRKNKVLPKREWIEEMDYSCAWHMNTPIFMKGSLRELMGADFIQQYPAFICNSGE